MLLNKEVAVFRQSNEFDTLLKIVGSDDVISFKNNNEWLKIHPAKALIFNNPEETWNRIKTTYRTTFKDLVIGELPSEDDLINTLKKVHKRLLKLVWNME